LINPFIKVPEDVYYKYITREWWKIENRKDLTSEEYSSVSI
jgi:hypothetical protein